MQLWVHPGDRRLLLALDGELSRRRQAGVDAHLQVCGACRARVRQLRSGLDEASRAYRLASTPSAFSASEARTRLERTLQAAGVEWDRAQPASDDRAWPLSPAAMTQIAATALLALGLAWFMALRLPASPERARMRDNGPLPIVALTPGAVSTLTAVELCAGARAPLVVTDDVRRRVLVQYGMTRVSADAYELDALITPELGGTADPRNLWPQRYASPVWNAHVKDALEQLLAERVCRQEMALTDAQQQIATNWVAAYKRYFKTEAPRPEHARSTAADDDHLVVAFRPPPAPLALLALSTPALR